MTRWYVFSVQPEPWQVPPMNVARKGGKLFVKSGKDQQLASYQETLRELFKETYPEPELVDGNQKLVFYFWRKLEVYKGVTRKVQRNPVDVTNLQKATEDALQGILFKNDSQVKDIRSVFVEQTIATSGLVVIRHEHYNDDAMLELPPSILAKVSENFFLQESTDNDVSERWL